MPLGSSIEGQLNLAAMINRKTTRSKVNNAILLQGFKDEMMFRWETMKQQNLESELNRKARQDVLIEAGAKAAASAVGGPVGGAIAGDAIEGTLTNQPVQSNRPVSLDQGNSSTGFNSQTFASIAGIFAGGG